MSALALFHSLFAIMLIGVLDDGNRAPDIATTITLLVGAVLNIIVASLAQNEHNKKRTP